MSRPRLAAVLLAALVVPLALAAAGCQSQPLQATPGISASPEASGVPPIGKFDPPVVITTAKALRDNDQLKFNDTIDNNPISRWARERLGIIQTNAWLLSDQNQALATRIKLALSGGEELPDVLFITDKDMPELLDELAESGKIMDIDDAFERYASARMKEAYARNADVWDTVAYKGKRWALPQISDDRVGSPILWIRQDWLDRLGLQPPNTLDELERVIHAFTYSDPDGNGEQDTIGLALAGQNTLNGWMGDASLVFGAYGDQPYQWNREPDGALAYGSIQPSVREGLAQLARWYREGYLDADFGTLDEQEAAQQFVDGKAGIISGPGWMGGWPLEQMAASGGVVKPIPYPAGPRGAIGKIGSQLSYGAYVFRSGFAHMDAIFAYLDAVYGALIEDPASDFAAGYAEGYDYMKKDGEYVYDFPGASSTISNFFLITSGSAPPHVLQGESLESRVLRGKLDTPYERRLASTTSRLYLQGLVVGAGQTADSHSNAFAGPYTKTMKTKWASLKRLEKETMLKIVYGSAPLDAFDAFAAAWRAQGGDEITREVNAQRQTSPTPPGAR
ncbi:extracellular solute-binding protein [Paenibacillus athensensis]|nr:extracellular solute-binding protein [Paenibacillus athensensis]MCD1257265.1 extracellular solute-binding protein [Paenibacillus athensensis]